jgi:L-ascorbate metabolism protein UlaG (beta-lactamase superfamily)
MKITKYEHACFTVELNGKMLVVDPGGYTTDFTPTENIVAVVVTHDHPDHFDAAALGAIIAHNPDAKVVAHETITKQFGDNGETLPYQSVASGDTITIDPFELTFNGGDHATIHDDLPHPVNLGVLINESIYYPGDSFVIPDQDVQILALPVSAPWSKLSESIDFLTKVKPAIAFPTHDAILSEAGKSLPDSMIPPFADKIGATYVRIDDSPLDV